MRNILLLVSSIFSPLVFAACSIPADSDIKLGVPYREQEQYNYCAAACVQMWRIYDGLPDNTSQQAIFNYMINGYCASNQLAVADAVRHFTNTYDAGWINRSSQDSYPEMAARQITSIDAGAPVIVVYRYDHTVVLQGGKWHPEDGLNVWDYIFMHDPAPGFGGANIKVGALDWEFFTCNPSNGPFCDQIESIGVTAAWNTNLAAHGSSVHVVGGQRGPYQQN
jgi:hypothetical protein